MSIEQQVRCINHIAGSDGVHLVGHSQGGLDARLIASRQGDEGLIKTLTTVATPHRGSVAADAFLDLPLAGRGPLTRGLAGLLGLAGKPDAEANLNQQMRGSRWSIWRFNRGSRSPAGAVSLLGEPESVQNRFVRDVASEAPAPFTRTRKSATCWTTLSLDGAAGGATAGGERRLGGGEQRQVGDSFMGCVPAGHLDG